MECHRIPVGDLPGVSLLYTTFLKDFPRVSQFYAHPASLKGILQAAEGVRLEDSVRQGVVEVLREQNQSFGGDEETSRNLDRLRDGAFAVVTGQQVGLFGGPAYSVYKALTAIHVARELTAKGTNAVPVFWLATSDHDLAEVDHCFISRRGGFERFELEAQGISDRRVGEIKLGEGVRELASRAAELLNGPAAEEVSRWLTECYRPEETFGSSFAKLMTRIFSGRGLIFLDPMSPELHRLSLPTMLRAAREHKSLAEELVARSAALESAGLHAQVKVTAQSTLLFRIVDGQRVALRPVKGGFIAGSREESVEETLQSLERNPEAFSPSALLRPVMQDTLLPTIAYVGGAAEIAYQAQTSLVYEKLLGRAPAILPRGSFTLVPAHTANLLKKYNLEIQDIFGGRHKLHAKMEAETLPEALSVRFDEAEKTIKSVLEALREPLGRLDQTLAGALDTASDKMLYQLNGLRSKSARAEGFRTGVLNTHENEIAGVLLPNNSLQERSLCFLSLLASEGLPLLDALDSCIRVGTGDHCVIALQPPAR
ncbi:MAG TPA: bacillithiol biosynthesis cysteine-adding enzyme BshC [Candidatus Dormibacteraeota bacterium]|nr:bacillithiol biosynthesis cysteine-adding enzyme BshC [Candidatus Dormibacteraeota bacterium]